MTIATSIANVYYRPHKKHAQHYLWIVGNDGTKTKYIRSYAQKRKYKPRPEYMRVYRARRRAARLAARAAAAAVETPDDGGVVAVATAN